MTDYTPEWVWTDWFECAGTQAKGWRKLINTETKVILRPTSYSWNGRDNREHFFEISEEHAELITSAPRLKEERDELLASVKSLLASIQAQGFLFGGPISEAETKARELLERIDRD